MYSFATKSNSRRVVDCTEVYWTADRIGGPAGKAMCTETEKFSRKLGTMEQSRIRNGSLRRA
jgi:transcriptional regulator of nitric oxide reductase